MKSPDNKSLIEQYFREHWNGRDHAAVDRMFAPGFSEGNSTTLGLLGDRSSDARSELERFKQRCTMIRSAFADIDFFITEIISEGDVVANRWIGKGTHSGLFRGIPPTGKRVEWIGSSFWTVREGLIHRLDILQDTNAILDQLRS